MKTTKALFFACILTFLSVASISAEIYIINNLENYPIEIVGKPFGAVPQALATKKFVVYEKEKSKKARRIHMSGNMALFTSGSVATFTTLPFLLEQLNATVYEPSTWTKPKKDLKTIQINFPSENFYPKDITNMPDLVFFFDPTQDGIFSVKAYKVIMGADLKKRLEGTGQFILQLPATLIEGLFKHKPESVETFEKLFEKVSKPIPLALDKETSNEKLTVYNVLIDKNN